MDSLVILLICLTIRTYFPKEKQESNHFHFLHQTFCSHVFSALWICTCIKNFINIHATGQQMKIKTPSREHNQNLSFLLILNAECIIFFFSISLLIIISCYVRYTLLFSIISFIFLITCLAFIPLKTINRESSAKHFTNTLQVFFLPVYSR